MVATTQSGPSELKPDNRRRIAVVDTATPAVGVELVAALRKTGVEAIFDRVAETRTSAGLIAITAADATLVVTTPSEGLSDRVKRDTLLAHHASVWSPLLVIAAAAGYPAAGVATLAREWAAFARRLGLVDAKIHTLPAELGPTAAALGQLERRSQPLRLWVEAVEAPVGATARITGRLLSLAPVVGALVIALPSATTATIIGCEAEAPGPDGKPLLSLLLKGGGGIRPGELLCAAEARPETADQVAADIVWMDDQPMLPGRGYRLRLGPQSVTAQIGTLKHKINATDLDPIAARQLFAGEVGHCNLSLGSPLVFDGAGGDRRLSRFELCDAVDGRTVGFGHISFTLRRSTNIHWQALSVGKAERAKLKGQTPCCLWFTGLSGSGKSTVASLLEKRLAALGRHTYTLDGDNVRHGLNRDLGFTDADRVENIRRVSEVAKLLVDAGLIVMVSFISPFRAERRMARELFPAGEFIEVFVDSPIEVCEQRDVKGLYKKARAGQLKNFTGIDSPYEPPDRAELHLKSGGVNPELMVDEVFRLLGARGIV